jgi:hypothetical protein
MYTSVRVTQIIVRGNINADLLAGWLAVHTSAAVG